MPARVIARAEADQASDVRADDAVGITGHGRRVAVFAAGTTQSRA